MAILALVLAAPPGVSAQLSVGIKATSVASRGSIAIFAGGDPAAQRLAVVLAPARAAPRFHSCESGAFCPPVSGWPVQPPLRILGWISFRHTHGPHWTTVGLHGVAPGRYKFFALWKSPHPQRQPYLLFAAGHYRGGGLVDDSQINGTTLLITATS
jgi:hypothetical protein